MNEQIILNFQLRSVITSAKSVLIFNELNKKTATAT